MFPSTPNEVLAPVGLIQLLCGPPVFVNDFCCNTVRKSLRQEGLLDTLQTCKLKLLGFSWKRWELGCFRRFRKQGICLGRSMSNCSNRGEPPSPLPPGTHQEKYCCGMEGKFVEDLTHYAHWGKSIADQMIPILCQCIHSQSLWVWHRGKNTGSFLFA